ncbi:hypothetical protein [Halalkalicoccus ordinarius]|uniref:hypothetical protein n=1 Tax=Halalkalicoccus ordinarius TaxID=3116651 RepID=UPI00300EB7A7
MSTDRIGGRIPARYRSALLVALLAGLAYALLLADLSSWLLVVAGSFSIGASILFLYLLYRLVLAVERISYEL